MNTNHDREELKSRLQSKEHRQAFVSAIVDQTIPFQIKAMRLAKHRNWTQEELARRADMKQERISTCENPNYGNFALRTLKQLAAAFDVGLVVRFAPFSELTEWEINMSSESLEVPSFNQEGDYFKEEPEGEGSIELLKAHYSDVASQQPKNQPSVVVHIGEYVQRAQIGSMTRNEPTGIEKETMAVKTNVEGRDEAVVG